MLRDASAPKPIQDFILGHKEAGQGGGYGSGPSLKTKASWIAKIDLSFLK
jgi:hypothetical protein